VGQAEETAKSWRERGNFIHSVRIWHLPDRSPVRKMPQWPVICVKISAAWQVNPPASGPVPGKWAARDARQDKDAGPTGIGKQVTG
jgi:nicotinamidase-related amidase